MSTYYNYYLGYEKDNKIYPLGPFDYKRKLLPVLSRSRSFASDLHEYFREISENGKLALSDEFKTALYSEWNNGSDNSCQYFNNVYYLPIDEMPVEDAIVDGYFLIKDVKAYLEDNSEWDIFYDRMTPLEYAERLRNELKSDYECPAVETDEKICSNHNTCKDYMYFRYKKKEGIAAETTKICEMLAFMRSSISDVLNYVVVCDIN